jgi:hypothetical protein
MGSSFAISLASVPATPVVDPPPFPFFPFPLSAKARGTIIIDTMAMANIGFVCIAHLLDKEPVGELLSRRRLSKKPAEGRR